MDHFKLHANSSNKYSPVVQRGSYKSTTNNLIKHSKIICHGTCLEFKENTANGHKTNKFA